MKTYVLIRMFFIGNWTHAFVLPMSEQLFDHSSIFNSEQVQSANLMNDLRRVGPNKPLSYLPLRTIVNICHEDPERLVQEARDKGLFATIKKGRHTFVESGAVYIADLHALQALIQQNEQTLRPFTIADNPLTPEMFIELVAATIFEQKTPMFDIIADAFADYTNPGRTNVQANI